MECTVQYVPNSIYEINYTGEKNRYKTYIYIYNVYVYIYRYVNYNYSYSITE